MILKYMAIITEAGMNSRRAQTTKHCWLNENKQLYLIRKERGNYASDKKRKECRAGLRQKHC